MSLRSLTLMSARSFVGLVAALSLSATPVAAQTESQTEQSEPQTRAEILRRQREEKTGQLAPYVISRGEERVRFLETWRLPRRLFAKGFAGFRPVIGGMPSGSGFVGGGGYIAGYNSDLLQFTANARYSTRGYTAYDAGFLIFPSSNSTLPIQGHITGGLRDFTSLRYFGLGPQTSRSDRTTYRLEDQTVETGFTASAGRFADFGATAQWLTTEVGPGSGSLSLDDRFDPSTTPGFGEETDFLVYGGHAVVHLRDDITIPSVGVTLQLDAHRYDDQDRGAFDFTRVVGDVQAHIPLGHRNRILALHARSSHSVGENGGIVPFHLMETLGGANSIRGFREYRFRDARNLLLNIEYRWEVWTYADFTFFYDAGKVFSDPNDLDLSNLKSGYGFGIRGHGPAGLVMRFDFARSNEGFILHIGSGPSF